MNKIEKMKISENMKNQKIQIQLHLKKCKFKKNDENVQKNQKK